jgi:hypothetical protein
VGSGSCYKTTVPQSNRLNTEWADRACGHWRNEIENRCDTTEKLDPLKEYATLFSQWLYKFMQLAAKSKPYT